jgi:hypothetical protein
VSQLNNKNIVQNKDKERPNSTHKKNQTTATTTVSDKMKFGESRLGKSRANKAPLLKKYKFIPTLAFKHN